MKNNIDDHILVIVLFKLSARKWYEFEGFHYERLAIVLYVE